MRNTNAAGSFLLTALVLSGCGSESNSLTSDVGSAGLGVAGLGYPAGAPMSMAGASGLVSVGGGIYGAGGSVMGTGGLASQGGVTQQQGGFAQQGGVAQQQGGAAPQGGVAPQGGAAPQGGNTGPGQGGAPNGGSTPIGQGGLLQSGGSGGSGQGGVVASGGAAGREVGGAGQGGNPFAIGGAQSGGAQSGGAQSGGAQSGGAQSGGAQSGGAQSGGAQSGGAQSGGTGGSAAGAASTGGAEAGGSTGCGVPTKFKWTSSAALITPPSGSLSIKDPSVVFFEDKWHIFATQYSSSYNMVYLNFTDWAQADSATKTLASTNPSLSGYKCAPQMFYFAPKDEWYLIYQTQEPAYSTTKTPSDVSSWSQKTQFMAMPSIIQNSDTMGIDYWVICNDDTCYMFFSADNGVLYRAETAKSSFPSGFGNTVIVMGDTNNKNALFEACNVYKMKGTDKYLLIVEAIGNGRYFRSWTSDSLDGEWTTLAATESNPFAGKSNVTGADWSNDGISHGEMLRDGYDEYMTIDTCNMQYLFQGRTQIGATYNEHKYSLGLLTATE